MRAMLLTSLATVALVAFAAPTAALADDCETNPDGCGGGGGPPPQPSLGAAQSVNGLYFVLTDSSYDYRYGFVTNGTTGFSGGGPFHPIGGDGTVTDGFADSTVSLRATSSPDDPSSATTATASAAFSSRASLTNAYLVELHASSAAAFAALEPALTTSGAIATIHGHYSLAATGTAYSTANVVTGVGFGGGTSLDDLLQSGAGSTCNFTGPPGTGCGPANYDLALNFITGSTFANGDPLSIYGFISLSTSVSAGGFDASGLAGTASAFIDPTITLNSLFNNPLYSLSVGNAITPYVGGAVPEPASWALMLVGFGLTGRAARRAARKTVLA
ncbi:PEPxxWA-CTERM sorting domain-containing protein [Polymorphobacter megasporae]|uniref:PEPxxWA-CTERM sorting domain-containing protein n=1 Tax=Glacieibacterium megasporae TaxID=2835787 RepID=UPI001C1E69B0|nr:PEPxxWA-CTERM sorting domain-containing protein [Polymorphobacter megasporae]UAJ09818.1 PEPxxWA-CTERM sorting domain-containing protein [Polymorphobacter megasporae]